jgi:hypothetical protein
MPTTTAGRVPTIRRMAIPATEPPYDEGPADVVPAPGRRGPRRRPATQGSLALSYLLPSGMPAAPELTVPLRLVDVPGPDVAESTLAALAPRLPTSSDLLPDPRRWSARLAQGIVEVLHGHRPLQQLVRWTDEAVYADLARRLTYRRPADAPRPRVRSIRVCQPSDGIAEASVVVQSGPRCRALAMRLEGLDGRWCCTVLEIL